ncbi:MAG: LOG family protein [bacterium]|nr:LOG family protein [bacterium]
MTVIAVFGSGKIDPDEPEYSDAREIGRRLARAGWAVMTGGYGGLMQAVSQGAHEGGGHVIGVTAAQLDARRRGTNPYVREEIKTATARERLMHLVMNADAYIVLPGGIGTFAELANVWEVIRVGDMPAKPILCYSEFWRRVAFELLTSKYVTMDHWTTTRFVDTPDQVMDVLHETLLSPKEASDEPYFLSNDLSAGPASGLAP